MASNAPSTPATNAGHQRVQTRRPDGMRNRSRHRMGLPSSASWAERDKVRPETRESPRAARNTAASSSPPEDQRAHDVGHHRLIAADGPRQHGFQGEQRELGQHTHWSGCAPKDCGRSRSNTAKRPMPRRTRRGPDVHPARGRQKDRGGTHQHHG